MGSLSGNRSQGPKNKFVPLVRMKNPVVNQNKVLLFVAKLLACHTSIGGVIHLEIARIIHRAYDVAFHALLHEKASGGLCTSKDQRRTTPACKVDLPDDKTERPQKSAPGQVDVHKQIRDGERSPPAVEPSCQHGGKRNRFINPYRVDPKCPAA